MRHVPKVDLVGQTLVGLQDLFLHVCKGTRPNPYAPWFRRTITITDPALRTFDLERGRDRWVWCVHRVGRFQSLLVTLTWKTLLVTIR